MATAAARVPSRDSRSSVIGPKSVSSDALTCNAFHVPSAVRTTRTTLPSATVQNSFAATSFDVLSSHVGRVMVRASRLTCCIASP